MISSGVAGRRQSRLTCRVVILALAAGLGVTLTACEEGPVPDDPAVTALVEVEGTVTDPGGSGVGDAEVTITMHESADCGSPVRVDLTARTGTGGGFSRSVGFDVQDPAFFEPHEVCLVLTAAPPASREDLEPSQPEEVVATLRSERDGPFDRVEVELVLPAGDGG